MTQLRYHLVTMMERQQDAMTGISKPFLRIVICAVAILAIVVFVTALHLRDLPLSVALNLFLIVVLVASIGWGARYAIYLAFIAALGFSWAVSPTGHFNLTDGRVWAVLAACLVTGLTASQLSKRLRSAVLESKRAEEALRRSEGYLAEAQRLTHTGSWAWAPNVGRQVPGWHYWSEEMFRIFEFDPARGSPPTREMWWQRIHPDDRQSISGSTQEALREKAEYVNDYRILLPDGQLKYIHAIGHPVFNDAGKIVEFVGTSVDVTDSKHAEAERERLRQLEVDLAHMNRVSIMGELAASLGHEIKQPIAAAITNANTCLRWLKREQPDLQEAREAGSRMVQDAMRAVEIINRTTSLYKKGPPRYELIDLNEVIKEIAALLHNEASRWEVSIVTDLAANLPKVAGDRVQLQQVLLNLAMNAVEAMKRVEGARELTVSSKRDGSGEVMVCVADTGVGLPPEKNRIFDAFFTTKPQGTGMGLAISRTIVEAHGGSLAATSNAGHGAMFYFRLPVALGTSA
jgi:signal transduction histidine kinase